MVAHKHISEGVILSQGTFESFPTEDNDLFMVIRYAERKTVRPTLAGRAEYVRIFPLKGEQISAQGKLVFERRPGSIDDYTGLAL